MSAPAASDARPCQSQRGAHTSVLFTHKSLLHVSNTADGSSRLCVCFCCHTPQSKLYLNQFLMTKSASSL